MSRKQILITGATGYVGARIVEDLRKLSSKYNIILASRNSNICDKLFPELEWRALSLDTNVKLRQCCEGIDTVIHLAGLNENECLSNELEAYRINTIGTKRLLDQSIKASVNRFILFSTAHIYGSLLKGIITEETIPFPAHPYSISNLSAEYYVLNAKVKNDIEGIVLRLSNSFGKPLYKDIVRWNLLVNDICKQAITTKRIKLISDGSQLRDFITLTDVANAIMHVLEMKISSKDNTIYNLGGDNVMSIYEMAEVVRSRYEAMTGIQIPIIKGKNCSVRSPGFVYSSKKIQESGYQLVNPINEEIDNTLKQCMKWFNE